jgi:hypothetical protein
VKMTSPPTARHDVDLTTGGVAVVGGSHSLPGFRRVRETYGEQEVRCAHQCPRSLRDGMMGVARLEHARCNWDRASPKINNVALKPRAIGERSNFHRTSRKIPIDLQPRTGHAASPIKVGLDQPDGAPAAQDHPAIWAGGRPSKNHLDPV